jgi:hypothetical protein
MKNGLFSKDNPSLTRGALRALGTLGSLLLSAHLLTATALAQGPAKAKNAKPGKPSAPAAAAIALTPEVLGAQAFLEELLVRRYSQELATRIEAGLFTLGSKLELVPAPPPEAPTSREEDSDTPSDLLLGTIDPDAILARYAGPEERAQMRAFLGNYRIKTVSVSVGLKEKAGKEAKTQAESWLTDRLKSEFGAAGKGAVTVIAPEPALPKTGLELLSDFQGLAGQVILALALLLGILLWRSRSGEAQQGAGGAGGGAGGGTGGEGSSEEKSDVRETTRDASNELAAVPAAVEIRQLGVKIKELLAGRTELSAALEPMVRNWCVSGDSGRLRLACFAEAAGTALGKLPVPADAIAEVSKAFARMPEVSIEQKREQLRKAYWDVLKALNLGADSLEEPFGYLGGMNLELLNEVLLDQNTKMKALVTFHMPATLRADFLRPMDSDSKRQLLLEAADLTQIAAAELRSTDGSLRNRLNAGGPKDVVKLPSALEKVIQALTRIEEVTLLSTMEGPAFEGFKRARPSLAFLAEWPDDKLPLLFADAMPQEVVALLRVREDLRAKVLGACPPMTGRITEDELTQPDKLKDPEKNQLLEQLSERLGGLVERREIDLTEIFGAQQVGEADGSGKKAA